MKISVSIFGVHPRRNLSHSLQHCLSDFTLIGFLFLVFSLAIIGKKTYRFNSDLVIERSDLDKTWRMGMGWQYLAYPKMCIIHAAL